MKLLDEQLSAVVRCAAKREQQELTLRCPRFGNKEEDWRCPHCNTVITIYVYSRRRRIAVSAAILTLWLLIFAFGAMMGTCVRWATPQDAAVGLRVGAISGLLAFALGLLVFVCCWWQIDFPGTATPNYKPREFHKLTNVRYTTVGVSEIIPRGFIQWSHLAVGDELVGESGSPERKYSALVSELKSLVASTRRTKRGSYEDYPEYERIRAIGKELDALGSMELMQQAHAEVSRDVYFSHDWWHRIGYWRN